MTDFVSPVQPAGVAAPPLLKGVISTFLFKRNAENTNGFQALMNLAGLLQLGKRLLDPRLKNPGKDLQEMIKSKVSNSKYAELIYIY